MTRNLTRLPAGLLLVVGLLSACEVEFQLRGAQAKIATDLQSLDFGTTEVGFRVVRTLVLSNAGVAPLHIQSLTIDGESADQFEVLSLQTSELTGNRSVEVTVIYRPKSEGTHGARLVVFSDANDTRELTIALTGVAVTLDPCAEVSCKTPPGPCFEEAGACSRGACVYPPKDEGTGCDDANACTEQDACSSAGTCLGTPKTCASPPASACKDAQTMTIYSATGTCGTDGACSYAPSEVACPQGCDLATGQCKSGCEAGKHLCNGACVDDFSPATCGTSCTPCPTDPQGAASCDGTQCGMQCLDGWHLCNGACVGDFSVATCGTSCTPCPTDPHGAATCDGTRCGMQCSDGWQIDGAACTDINECLTGNGGCHANATCSNTPGSRTCACSAGYTGDGFSCTLDGFVWIAPGTFTMGSPFSELGRRADEAQHQVTLMRGYYLQDKEVTQGQWQALMGNNPSNFSSCGSGCPVETVNWWEALAYANAVSSAQGLAECYTLTGCTGTPGIDIECSGVTVNAAGGNPYECVGYRLPTEAEWEYAYRAGTTTAFYNGGITEEFCGMDANLNAIGWYCGNAGSRTHSVGQKAANGWGLFDMSGNVAEWCWDWYGSYPGAVTDPGGPGTGTSRVRRSGSWGSGVQYTRAAYRYDGGPGLRSDYLGLRLAKSQP
ncbi:MAG: SUMF1/EgtB/PvdO family nonheme iron enzyme [Deltaproteobacteria bacterium]|nr:SUMF1/EgtB/PvdO family nonheme iron enzyme [Deltaproteobacteria bacterium]